jgi:hypothetical protein
MLRDLKNKALAIIIDLKRVLNRGQTTFKFNIDDRADYLTDFTNCFCCHGFVTPG